MYSIWPVLDLCNFSEPFYHECTRIEYCVTPICIWKDLWGRNMQGLEPMSPIQGKSLCFSCIKGFIDFEIHTSVTFLHTFVPHLSLHSQHFYLKKINKYKNCSLGMFHINTVLHLTCRAGSLEVSVWTYCWIFQCWCTLHFVCLGWYISILCYLAPVSQHNVNTLLYNCATTFYNNSCLFVLKTANAQKIDKKYIQLVFSINVLLRFGLTFSCFGIL